MIIKNKIDIEIHKKIEKLELTEFSMDFVSDYRQTYSWHEKNKKTLIYTLDDDSLVGHMSFLPINEELFNRIKNGDEIDTKISESQILNENVKDIYLYFCVVFMDKKYRGKGLAFEMYEYYKNLFKDYNINGIVSDAISESGEHFCKKIGLEFHKESNHGSKIYKNKKC